MSVRSFWSFLLAILLGLQAPYAWAQEQAAPQKLNITIIEGEGAINNIRQRVAREPIVQVEDENRKPVAGASVVFLLPNQGASGVFTDGSRMLTVVTDDTGRAAMRGFQPNNVAGKMQIRVTASTRGVTSSAVINQSNVLGAAAAGGAAAGGSGKLIAILAVIGGAAAGGVVAATRGGKTPTSPTTPTGPPPPAPTVITPGSPSVGPPR
ncbi:MAG: hypothetical protein HY235_08275 [Acidobacteria bacterium]|nr:hypothetical protein [Acidobacteriota bacterium]